MFSGSTACSELTKVTVEGTIDGLKMPRSIKRTFEWLWSIYVGGLVARIRDRS